MTGYEIHPTRRHDLLHPLEGGGVDGSKGYCAPVPNLWGLVLGNISVRYSAAEGRSGLVQIVVGASGVHSASREEWTSC